MTTLLPGPRICGQCHLPAIQRRHLCAWHWLLTQPAPVRIEAEWAQAWTIGIDTWPACVTCERQVPTFYFMTRAKRCKSCDALVKLDRRAQKTYGLQAGEYERLLAYQGGRCAICGRQPRAMSLAVDHDHETGKVRGLLCASSNRGCNNALLPLISGPEMAREVVRYLVDPPYERMREGR